MDQPDLQNGQQHLACAGIPADPQGNSERFLPDCRHHCGQGHRQLHPDRIRPGQPHPGRRRHRFLPGCRKQRHPNSRCRVTETQASGREPEACPLAFLRTHPYATHSKSASPQQGWPICCTGCTPRLGVRGKLRCNVTNGNLVERLDSALARQRPAASLSPPGEPSPSGRPVLEVPQKFVTEARKL